MGIHFRIGGVDFYWTGNCRQDCPEWAEWTPGTPSYSLSDATGAESAEEIREVLKRALKEGLFPRYRFDQNYYSCHVNAYLTWLMDCLMVSATHATSSWINMDLRCAYDSDSDKESCFDYDFDSFSLITLKVQKEGDKYIDHFFLCDGQEITCYFPSGQNNWLYTAPEKIILYLYQEDTDHSVDVAAFVRYCEEKFIQIPGLLFERISRALAFMYPKLIEWEPAFRLKSDEEHERLMSAFSQSLDGAALFRLMTTVSLSSKMPNYPSDKERAFWKKLKPDLKVATDLPEKLMVELITTFQEWFKDYQLDEGDVNIINHSLPIEERREAIKISLWKKMIEQLEWLGYKVPFHLTQKIPDVSSHAAKPIVPNLIVWDSAEHGKIPIFYARQLPIEFDPDLDKLPPVLRNCSHCMAQMAGLVTLNTFEEVKIRPKLPEKTYSNNPDLEVPQLTSPTVEVTKALACHPVIPLKYSNCYGLFEQADKWCLNRHHPGEICFGCGPRTYKAAPQLDYRMRNRLPALEKQLYLVESMEIKTKPISPDDPEKMKAPYVKQSSMYCFNSTSSEGSSGKAAEETKETGVSEHEHLDLNWTRMTAWPSEKSRADFLALFRKYVLLLQTHWGKIISDPLLGKLINRGGDHRHNLYTIIELIGAFSSRGNVIEKLDEVMGVGDSAWAVAMRSGESIGRSVRINVTTDVGSSVWDDWPTIGSDDW